MSPNVSIETFSPYRLHQSLIPNVLPELHMCKVYSMHTVGRVCLDSFLLIYHDKKDRQPELTFSKHTEAQCAKNAIGTVLKIAAAVLTLSKTDIHQLVTIELDCSVTLSKSTAAPSNFYLHTVI